MATNTSIATGNMPSVITEISLYVAPSNAGGTRVVQFTVANTTALAASYSVIVRASAATTALKDELISNKSVAANDYDIVSGAIMYLIPPGYEMLVKVSVADSLTFFASGVAF
jgi:hypothetical protein